jgi:antitoxin PrlF
MSRAKVTSNGRITIPVGVRNALGVKAGDLVDFVEMQEGVYIVFAKIPVGRLKGLLSRPGNPVSIDDMNVAIATRIASSHCR